MNNNNKIAFLSENNIPEPVVGGIAFSILAAIAHTYFDINFNFDMSFKNPLMIIFFTTEYLSKRVSINFFPKDPVPPVINIVF